MRNSKFSNLHVSDGVTEILFGPRETIFSTYYLVLKIGNSAIKMASEWLSHTQIRGIWDSLRSKQFQNVM